MSEDITELDLTADVYTLELPADGYEDVTQWDSGKLTIEQTPEQRERFVEWLETEVMNE